MRQKRTYASCCHSLGDLTEGAFSHAGVEKDGRFFPSCAWSPCGKCPGLLAVVTVSVVKDCAAAAVRRTRACKPAPLSPRDAPHLSAFRTEPEE